MAERVICNRCGAEYTDKESIELAKKWVKEGYAPCPNLSCPGQLEVKEAKHVDRLFTPQQDTIQ